MAFADTIAASALNLEPSQQINPQLFARLILSIQSMQMTNLKKSTYTRQILLQVLGSQTAEKKQSLPIPTSMNH